tara:strand:- start:388 stop:570 length:183 start_codon:yes stop_codon:yes gene_type:complete
LAGESVLPSKAVAATGTQAVFSATVTIESVTIITGFEALLTDLEVATPVSVTAASGLTSA